MYLTLDVSRSMSSNSRNRRGPNEDEVPQARPRPPMPVLPKVVVLFTLVSLCPVFGTLWHHIDLLQLSDCFYSLAPVSSRWRRVSVNLLTLDLATLLCFRFHQVLQDSYIIQLSCAPARPRIIKDWLGWSRCHRMMDRIGIGIR